jgi:hypothetical protein
MTPSGLGVPIAPGLAKAFLASADGTWLAWLDGCQEVRGRFLPPGTSSCDLKVVPSAGGTPKRVARAVTSLPHGALFAPEGSALAALSEYDYETGAGTLLLVRDSIPLELASAVTFHGFLRGGDGALLAVAGGRLLTITADGVSRSVSGTEGVASFDAAPTPWDASEVAVLARRPASAGGSLLALDADLAHARLLAEGTRDFALAPGGAFAFTTVRPGGTELRLGLRERSRSMGSGARTFAFSADGSALAWIGDAVPGKQGDLYVARLDGKPQLLGREVGELRWATRAPRLAWLERYDPRTRSGALGVGSPGEPVQTLGRSVTDFELSPDGGSLAFLRHTADGGYSVDLELADARSVSGTGTGTGTSTGSSATGAANSSRRVARGVFGFAFSPDGRWLLYRTRCTRQAEACDLERVAVRASAASVPSTPPGTPLGTPRAVRQESQAGEKPEVLARGIKSFEFDPRDPNRLLLTWQRQDSTALDVAVWQGHLVAVDQGVLPGSARFLGPDSRRLAYAVVQPKRAGLYVATLPPP